MCPKLWRASLNFTSFFLLLMKAFKVLWISNYFSDMRSPLSQFQNINFYFILIRFTKIRWIWINEREQNSLTYFARVSKVHILQVYPCLVSILVSPLNAQQSAVSTLTNVLLHMHDINVVLKLLILPVWKLVQNTYLRLIWLPNELCLLVTWMLS